jgi:hypothetical protein
LKDKTDIVDIFVALVRERDRAENLCPKTWKYPPGTVLITFGPRDNDDHRAMYHVDEQRIEIYRYGCTHQDANSRAVDLAGGSLYPLEELISFVHELGHHEATLAGMPCIFAESRPAETYESELHAWILGREILASTPFLDWVAFDGRRKASLEDYRVELGLTEEAADVIEVQIGANVVNNPRSHPIRR